ncbi:hypothetical protein NM208_g13593 [Fusarium decemcellulare]|uniref:Uncharacterized protein n=1 Tax=Fusarium decemcellulare TaxID=57161 RepID=A0ACC1RMS2_9HYPO|nr:hypothetical protein NM208_g13593 [Fusarium decemcellulare]
MSNPNEGGHGGERGDYIQDEDCLARAPRGPRADRRYWDMNNRQPFVATTGHSFFNNDRFANDRYRPTRKPCASDESSQVRIQAEYRDRVESVIDSLLEEVESSKDWGGAPSWTEKLESLKFVAKNSETTETKDQEAKSPDRGPDSVEYGVRQAHLDLSRDMPVRCILRSTDWTRPEWELSAGTIISAPVHTASNDDIVSVSDPDLSISRAGVVISKFRKMIVVQVWSQHVVCLPLFSYGNKGLEGRYYMRDEYLDIRDVEDDKPKPKQTDNEPLMAKRHPAWPPHKTFITGFTVVKLTEKLVHDKRSKCSVEGNISKDELERLCDLCSALDERSRKLNASLRETEG